MTPSEYSLPPTLELLDNGVLTWGLISCGIAQLSKLFVELIEKKVWRPKILLETGGMPSSHSALVTGTAACLGWDIGFNSSQFALATTVALVVMYDASGIRRAAGYTAERVNEITSNIPSFEEKKPINESLGHSKIQVLIGSIIGPTIALPGFVFVGSPVHFLEQLGLILG